MNQLLQKAFDRAAEFPRAEQDRFALFLLADEALAEHRGGRTRPLDLEDL